MTNKSVYLLIVFLFFVTTAKAQTAGTLDPTFSDDGQYTLNFGFTDNLNDVTIQNDQKILLTGVALNSSYTGVLKVIRLLPNGSLDTSFGINGVFSFLTTTETYGFESYALSNGKIIVAGLAAETFGYYDILLLRLNSDGTLDTSFGTNGSTVANFSIRDDFAYAMTVQNDGKIVVAGTITDTINYYNNPSIVRFRADGMLDTTFGNNGIATVSGVDIDNELTSIVVQNDGKIVAAGHYSDVFDGSMDFDVLLTRLDANGTLDATFGNNGVVKTSINGGIDDSFGIALDNNQNIVVTGFTTLPFTLTYDMVLLKYTPNGSLDPDFGTAGIVTFNNADYDVGADVVVQPDNKIVVGGTSGFGGQGPRDFTAWRYLPNGTLDNTFGINGFATAPVGIDFQDVNSMALQADGKIVLAGKSSNGSNIDMAAVRYLGDIANTVPNISIEDALLITPNIVSPSSLVTVQVSPKYANTVQLNLVNTLGEKVFSTQIHIITNDNNMSFALPNSLKSGVYFLTITDGQTKQTQKLVVQ
jgi:uncharacterized delta-60 repeat protein